MKRIEKILSYNFTPEEEEALISSEIANGCGGKGGVSFDLIIEDNLKYIPSYDEKQKKEFFNDLKRICIEHDVDFRLKKGFYIANFQFARKIFLLTKWAENTHRLSLALVCFFLLNKYGKKFYYINK